MGCPKLSLVSQMKATLLMILEHTLLWSGALVPAVCVVFFGAWPRFGFNEVTVTDDTECSWVATVHNSQDLRNIQRAPFVWCVIWVYREYAGIKQLWTWMKVSKWNIPRFQTTSNNDLKVGWSLIDLLMGRWAKIALGKFLSDS